MNDSSLSLLHPCSAPISLFPERFLINSYRVAVYHAAKSRVCTTTDQEEENPTHIDIRCMHRGTMLHVRTYCTHPPSFPLSVSLAIKESNFSPSFDRSEKRQQQAELLRPAAARERSKPSLPAVNWAHTHTWMGGCTVVDNGEPTDRRSNERRLAHEKGPRVIIINLPCEDIFSVLSAASRGHDHTRLI